MFYLHDDNYEKPQLFLIGFLLVVMNRYLIGTVAFQNKIVLSVYIWGQTSHQRYILKKDLCLSNCVWRALWGQWLFDIWGPTVSTCRLSAHLVDVAQRRSHRVSIWTSDSAHLRLWILLAVNIWGFAGNYSVELKTQFYKGVWIPQHIYHHWKVCRLLLVYGINDKVDVWPNYLSSYLISFSVFSQGSSSVGVKLIYMAMQWICIWKLDISLCKTI